MNEFKKYLRHHAIRPIMNRTIVLSILLILIFAWPVWGATYYVKAGGNDSLDGRSDATAWATIAKVQATATSGDTVYFRSQDTWSGIPPLLSAKAGVTYDGSSYGGGTRAKLRATGPYSGLPTLLCGVVNLFVDNVTFKGFEVDGNTQITGGIYAGTRAATNISNITIDNCVVHDVGDNDVPTIHYLYGIHIGPTPGNITVSNVTLTNTTVYNTSHEALAIYPGWGQPNNKVDTVLVRNCTLHDSGKSGHGYSEGIYLVNNSDNVTIEYNTIYNNGNGINIGTSMYDGMGSVNNLIVRYNLIYENLATGIVLNFCSPTDTWAADGVFYDNIILNSGSAAGGVGWASDINIANSYAGNLGSYGNSTFSFYNNTIYNTKNAAAGKGGVQVARFAALNGTPTINFKNNIVYTSTFTSVDDSRNLLTHSNNLIFRSSGAADEHVNNGTSYNRAGVTTWEPTAKNTDPTFTGGTLPTGFTGTYGTNMVPNTNYFSITSGDALNNGAILGSPYNGCINGAGLATPILRPQGAAYDIGAYQYGGINPNTLLYADFQGYGLYKWNGSAWSQLNSVVATGMTASGSTLYANFPGLGLYKWDGSAWSQLKSVVATGMTASGSDLYANFAGLGLYAYNGISWTRINATHPASMVASGVVLYANFAGDGLYSWNGTAWTRLTNSNSASMVAAGSTLYVDFAGYGLYAWNGTAWTRLTNSHPAGMVAAGTVLYANFAGDGLYSWNGTAWTRLTNSNSASMVASGSTLYVDFAGYGLYSWNGTAWTQLTNAHPASMLAAGSTLYVDFTAYGLYSWSGTAWTQINTVHPIGMVAN